AHPYDFEDGEVHMSSHEHRFGLFSSVELRSSLSFVSWNPEGWKTSLCSVPPLGHAHSLLALANNTCVKISFNALRERYTRLYRKKAHLHHYLQVEEMEVSVFSEAAESLSCLIDAYEEIDHASCCQADAPRLMVAS
ncbi:hypothetical protein CRUP_010034, partial [Coryphaenoides rupestris]